VHYTENLIAPAQSKHDSESLGQAAEDFGEPNTAATLNDSLSRFSSHNMQQRGGIGLDRVRRSESQCLVTPFEPAGKPLVNE
jgi:hypothetical protein